jgi:hypothetical protein
MKEERKRTGNGYYLFIARVCPAAGEPDLKTPHPQNGNIEISVKGMNKTWIRCKLALGHHQKGNGNQRCRQRS